MESWKGKCKETIVWETAYFCWPLFIWRGCPKTRKEELASPEQDSLVDQANLASFYVNILHTIIQYHTRILICTRELLRILPVSHVVASVRVYSCLCSLSQAQLLRTDISICVLTICLLLNAHCFFRKSSGVICCVQQWGGEGFVPDQWSNSQSFSTVTCRPGSPSRSVLYSLLDARFSACWKRRNLSQKTKELYFISVFGLYSNAI